MVRSLSTGLWRWKGEGLGRFAKKGYGSGEDITVEKTVGICIMAAIWEAIFFQNLASKELFREHLHHI